MASKSKLPPADRTWCADAKALWRSINRDYVLDSHHSLLLKQCCELVTRAAAARKEIKRLGLLTKNRFGSWQENPAVSIERSSLSAARLLLRELSLDFSEEAGGRSEPFRLPRAGGYVR